MRKLLLRWVVTAVSLYVAVQLIPGLEFQGPWWGLLIVALVFGLVNALVRPLLTVLSCPLVIVTLGLFLLIINGAMLALTARLVGPWFEVHGLWPAVWGSILISVVGWLLNVLLGLDEKEQRRSRG